MATLQRSASTAILAEKSFNLSFPRSSSFTYDLQSFCKCLRCCFYRCLYSIICLLSSFSSSQPCLLCIFKNLSKHFKDSKISKGTFSYLLLYTNVRNFQGFYFLCHNKSLCRYLSLRCILDVLTSEVSSMCVRGRLEFMSSSFLTVTALLSQNQLFNLSIFEGLIHIPPPRYVLIYVCSCRQDDENKKLSPQKFFLSPISNYSSFFLKLSGAKLVETLMGIPQLSKNDVFVQFVEFALIQEKLPPPRVFILDSGLAFPPYKISI